MNDFIDVDAMYEEKFEIDESWLCDDWDEGNDESFDEETELE